MLKNNYKDEILNEGDKRSYNIVSSTGEVLYSNVHLEKTYVPLQEGDMFGALDVNTITGEINKIGTEKRPLSAGGTGENLSNSSPNGIVRLSPTGKNMEVMSPQDGALYGTNGTTKFGVLPSELGGTGKTNLDNVITGGSKSLRDMNTGGTIQVDYFTNYLDSPAYIAAWKSGGVLGSITYDTVKNLLGLTRKKLNVSPASSSFSNENIDLYTIDGLGIGFIRGYVKTSKSLSSGTTYTIGKIGNSKLYPQSATALSKYSSRNVSVRVFTDGSVQLEAHSNIGTGYGVYFAGIYMY